MTNSNFLQSKDLFSLNTLKCLRNEYLYNDCKLCFDLCQSEALNLFKEKIHLYDEACISCGDCLGVCPTEALNLDNFDSVDFVINFKDKDKIIEKIDIPSLSILDFYLLSSIVIRNKTNLVLEYQDKLNTSKKEYLQKEIDLTNNFLKSIGIENCVNLEKNEEDVSNSRRGLFKSIFKAKKEIEKEDKSSNILKDKEKTLPAKVILFKNSLKTFDIKEEEINLDILSSKKISYEKCTNCLDCITFCPTNALFQNSSKESIYFQSGKCISCNICHDVCKEDAITNSNDINLIEYSFDRANELVKFEYISCKECHTPFIAKKDDEICPRCIDFSTNFPDMFAMAKDI